MSLDVPFQNQCYDPVGNRLSSLGVASYSYNPSNELTMTSNGTFGYDYNGNLTSKTNSSGTTSYAWDFENRPTQVTLPNSGGTVTFEYDPFGRRIQKVYTTGATPPTTTTTNYLYDGDNVVEMVDQNGNLLSRFAQGQNIDEPLALSAPGATDFYEQDGLGTVTSLTNGSGAIAQSYTFDSYGNTTNSSGNVANPFRYTGRDFDSETGLYYYRARYYDASTGRFDTEDPARSSLKTNAYEYVHNRPNDRIDTSGMEDHYVGYKDHRGCTLIGTLKILLYSSYTGKTPIGWHFNTSYQEGPERLDPIATLTCIWNTAYLSERWGHYLVLNRYRCSKNDCVLGYVTWDKNNFSWEVDDLGKAITYGGPTTTTSMPILGEEDETNDILCVTKPILRPW